MKTTSATLQKYLFYFFAKFDQITIFRKIKAFWEEQSLRLAKNLPKQDLKISPISNNFKIQEITKKTIKRGLKYSRIIENDTKISFTPID